MLSIRWTIGDLTILDLTIGGTDQPDPDPDPDPEALPTWPTAGYVGEGTDPVAFIRAFIQSHRAD